MIALGLACENVAMLVGQPWTGLWLIFWVITNVSTSFYDIGLGTYRVTDELKPSLLTQSQSRASTTLVMRGLSITLWKEVVKFCSTSIPVSALTSEF